MQASVRVRRVLVLSLALFGVAVAIIALAALTALSKPADATSVPTLDHFQCYSASATSTPDSPKAFGNTPAKVLMKNKFATGGFVASPGAVQMHCNPAQKTVPSGGHTVTTPITNADAHLLCRAIKPSGLTLPPLVTMKNGFGTGALMPTAALSLCLPSWETSTTPLKFPAAPSPPNLDAFACYAVTHPSGTPGFTRPDKAQLKDDFGSISTSVGSANVLCMPTSETATASGTQALINPDRWLVCFSLPPAASIASRVVYDKNVFGVGAVKIVHNTELCLPSTKVANPPPTTTEPTTTTTAPGVVTNYSGPGIDGPYDIAAGPDNALWFTNYFGSSIGRVSVPDGTVTNFPSNAVARPDGIERGTDGAMWFANTINSTIGRVATDGTGVFTSYGDPRIGTPYRVAAGPGGVTWFTGSSNQSVGWVTANGTVNVFYSSGIVNPQGITAGPDGAMWFCNFYGSSIGRVTASGDLKFYGDRTVVAPLSITAGPDGALWFTNPGNSSIGRIATDGTITNFTDSGISSPIDIVTGSDGNLWFTNYGNNSIGRITPDGQVTDYVDPTIISPDGIAAGPDGAIWFTNAGNNTIGRVSV